MSEMSAIQSVHLKCIEHYLNLNLANPDLSPNTVAAACHLSVRYLQKLFALKKSLIGSAMATKVTFLAFINSILVIRLEIRPARDNKVLLTLN